jgi:DNA-directed RNA polymerase subunit RPC12/RpoP
MLYTCPHCNWTGTWIDLIHETACPRCRSSVMADDGSGRQAAPKGATR